VNIYRRFGGKICRYLQARGLLTLKTEAQVLTNCCKLFSAQQRATSQRPTFSQERYFGLCRTRRISWTASFTTETQVTGTGCYAMKLTEIKLLNSLIVGVPSYIKTLTHFSSCIMRYNIDAADNMMTVRLQNIEYINELNDNDIM